MRAKAASLGAVCIVLLAGCQMAPTRVSTRVTDVPRVDLELGGGNRGYLIGTPSEAGEWKTTRQIIQTDIEIPSFYKPKPGSGNPVSFEADSAIHQDAEGIRIGAGRASVESGPMDSYGVQKGDSLWSIAAKPEIYGKATAWRRLLDANQHLLNGDPNRLRAGMTLNIPRGKASQTFSSGEDDGTTFRK